MKKSKGFVRADPAGIGSSFISHIALNTKATGLKTIALRLISTNHIPRLNNTLKNPRGDIVAQHLDQGLSPREANKQLTKSGE